MQPPSSDAVASFPSSCRAAWGPRAHAHRRRLEAHRGRHLALGPFPPKRRLVLRRIAAMAVIRVAIKGCNLESVQPGSSLFGLVPSTIEILEGSALELGSSWSLPLTWRLVCVCVCHKASCFPLLMVDSRMIGIVASRRSRTQSGMAPTGFSANKVSRNQATVG